MKHTGLIISVFMLASAVCGAHAIKLCQLDWFAAWQNANGTLSDSSYKYTTSWTDGAPGIWAVTSDQGSGGVKHSVSGASTCSNSSTAPNSISTGNQDDEGWCWCLMTSPHLGASWVLYGNTGGPYPAFSCSNACARLCATCVQAGSSGSCTRAAVLALP
ncbi:MAG: hypothetical protein LBL21_01425 [Rickettsiales bacterium]|jgi:hypothetical protein|nr:hypothetical protein [Rickettsiales bacterium]